MSLDIATLVSALKRKREDEGLSLRKLSNEIGISFSTLARIERGDGEPDNNSSLRILEWLGEYGREHGLTFENVAFVHFRAAKNVSSQTIEHLLHVADIIKSKYIAEHGLNPHSETGNQSIDNIDYQPIPLSKAEMEVMANKFRSDLKISVESPLPALQIEIEGVEVFTPDVIEGVNSKQLKHLKNTGSMDWSAMSVPLNSDNTKWAILRNNDHTIERQRVTYLEEFWHIYLGHKLTKVARIADSYGRSYESSEEHDAFYLASACLLPESSVTKMVISGQSAKEIAGHFGTSTELVDYRVKRLGLWGTYKGLQIKLSENH